MSGANLPAKIYKHSTPTELRLVFEIESDRSGGYIDLAQAISTLNRRFMRQGVYYYINSMEVETLQDGYVQVEVAPDTWATQQAWKRAFRTFQKMNSMVDTPRPKYHDFKVFLDLDHRNHIMDNNENLLPILTQGIGPYGQMSSDEWVYSQFVNFNDRTDSGVTSTLPNQFNIHVVGPHDGTGPSSYSSIGMIKSYSDSRSQPSVLGDPQLPSANDDDPLSLLFQGSEVHAIEEIAEHLDMYNDTTPYDRNVYPGTSNQGNLVPLERLYTSSAPSARAHKVAGACIPFGLMRISSDMTGYRFIVNVASGTYNGVYAERV